MILSAYVDLKFMKAFDSVHHEAFWTLQLSRIPGGIVGLLIGMYPGTVQ